MAELAPAGCFDDIIMVEVRLVTPLEAPDCLPYSEESSRLPVGWVFYALVEVREAAEFVGRIVFC